MPYELPPDRRTARRARIAERVTFAVSAVLVALIAYLGYVGYEGSRQLTDPPARSADCRTPQDFGWEYEAINYDQAADAELAAEADRRNCRIGGAHAGTELTASDGVPIAGWYIPAAAAAGIGPEGPTVMLAHGWGSNKSAMLDRATILQPDYNLVLFDFRNHGQSGTAQTTLGMRERADLRAVLDWLVETKGPEAIALLGTSMGGAAAAYTAASDQRVDSLILESTHATLAGAAERRIANAGYPLSLPGAWAVLMGSLVRTGLDLSAADPIRAVARLDERPLLIISGGVDDTLGPTDAADMFEAATEAGSPTELHVCDAAGHGGSFETCAAEFPDWVLGFLERTIGR
jgi:pimeloyl-ACP methyl ester carboxylesterase